MLASGAITAALRKPAREADKSVAARIITYASDRGRSKIPLSTHTQQLANIPVGVPFYFGTHYVALHLLGGFLPRDMVKLCSAPSRLLFRLQALLAGEVQATTLTEPHLWLAEKLGCRIGLFIVLSRHRSCVRSRGCRDLCRVQAGRAGGCQAHQRQQVGLSVHIYRLPCATRRGRRRPCSRCRICAKAASW